VGVHVVEGRGESLVTGKRKPALKVRQLGPKEAPEKISAESVEVHLYYP